MAKLHRPLRQVVPWIVSGASGFYIMRRARQLSVEAPRDETLTQFLVHKGDLLVFIVGSPTVWHFARRAPAVLQLMDENIQSATATRFHQLRQVFTVLTLGLELLRRRLLSGETNTMLPLLRVLGGVIMHGQEALAGLERDCADHGYAVPTAARTTEQRNQQSP